MTEDTPLVAVMTAGAVVLTRGDPLPIEVVIADCPRCPDSGVVVGFCAVTGTEGLCTVVIVYNVVKFAKSSQLGTSSAR